MSARTITVPLRAGPRPGTVEATVHPGPESGLDGPTLEKVAHDFLRRLPAEPGLQPAGLRLIESGLQPPETGPWITVWDGGDKDVVAEPGATFTFTTDAEDPATSSTTNNAAQSKGTKMAIQDRIRNLADDPDLPAEHRETLRGVARGVESSAGLEKAHARAHELRKQDPTLTASKAMEQAMREPEIAALYKAEMESRGA